MKWLVCLTTFELLDIFSSRYLFLISAIQHSSIPLLPIADQAADIAALKRRAVLGSDRAVCDPVQPDSCQPGAPPICIPAAPSRAGLRAGGRGQRRSPLDRNAGDEAIPVGSLAGSLHPRCQSESLLPPSPPTRIPAAPLKSGPAGRRAGPAAIPLSGAAHLYPFRRITP